MGMFDTGYITCPHCGKVTEEQTKDLDCILRNYNLDEPIDPHVLNVFTGEWICEECGKTFYIKDIMPIEKVKAETTIINLKEE